MKTFYYYSGDWIKGFCLLFFIQAEKLTDADVLFEKQIGIPAKNMGISVTLQKKEDSCHEL